MFEPGDAWMRTGDLMRRDAEGFYTFVDRIGDTFAGRAKTSRRRGRSRSRRLSGVAEAIVYGVAVPGADGRAGMASLTIDERFDLVSLLNRLEALPRYARPRSSELLAKSRPPRPSNQDGANMPPRALTPLGSAIRFTSSTPSERSMYRSTPNGSLRSEPAPCASERCPCGMPRKNDSPVCPAPQAAQFTIEEILVRVEGLLRIGSLWPASPG